MIRETSSEAYEELVSSGVLGKQQLLVYRHLRTHGPLTAQECLFQMKTEMGAGAPPVWKRLSELRRMGLVREMETRTCRVTGRNVIVWGVDPLVSRPTKIPSRKKDTLPQNIVTAVRAYAVAYQEEHNAITALEPDEERCRLADLAAAKALGDFQSGISQWRIEADAKERG